MGRNTCPRCGSNDIGTTGAHKAKQVAAFAGDVALAMFKGAFGRAGNFVSNRGGFMRLADNTGKEMRCKNCGHVWHKSSY